MATFTSWLAYLGTFSGAPNFMAGDVEPADWDELTDEQADDIICSCSVGEEE